ncbi:MAG: hypothetical protein ACK2TU_03305 [Anaerolineales bacterium]
MYRLIRFGFLAIIIIFLYSMNSYAAKNNWESASKSMVWALKSNNDGLKISVLHQIVKYSDSLDVNNAVFDVMRIYRNHPDERIRHLALIALHKMGNNWSMEFLKRRVLFENNPALYKCICAILCDYYGYSEPSDTLIAVVK